MPLNIARAKRVTQDASFEYETDDGQTEAVSLTWDLSAYTPAFEKQLRAGANDQLRQMEGLALTLSKLLVSWDVVRTKVDADGEPVLGRDGQPELEPCPTDYDTLSQLDGTFLAAAVAAINGSARPNGRRSAR